MLISDTFTEADLIGTATKAVTADEYVEIASITILQGEEIAFGSGLFGTQQDATGRAFADLYDNGVAPGVQLNGKLRLQVTDMNDNLVFYIGEWDLSKLRFGLTDVRQRKPLPLQKQGAGFGRKIKVFFKCTTTATLSQVNSTMEFDISKKYVR